MEIHFTKFSPTQNVTILVENTLPREAHARVAEALLAYDGVGGEQVGFLETPTKSGIQARLQMMGGEFCGNATMALGAYLAWKDGLTDSTSSEYLLEISGADSPIPCQIERYGNIYRSTVQIPLPESTNVIALETDDGIVKLPIVMFPGIAHIIAPVDQIKISEEEIHRRIRDWSKKIPASALGFLRYNVETENLDPFVYVPSTDTVFQERGCGSGTAAIGCWMSLCTNKAYHADIHQRGGVISVSTNVCGDHLTTLSISGNVRIICTGLAYVD